MVVLLAGCATGEATRAGEGGGEVGAVAGSARAAASGKGSPKGAIGMTREQLVQRYGEPDQTMDVTRLGGPISEAYVYSPERTGSKCFDAFVVLEETGEVIDHFCR
ncbi:MAG: hypothetical protein HQL59_02395 [Magnetococcales bacterium]|nr:hypothetical protein [Magnetococcales bacterium]